MGTETEYAVSVRQDPHANPVQSSFDVIAHAGDEETRHIRWDYRQEDPVHDMRGMTMPRSAARPDMLTDEPQRNITNAFAANGGRMYVDHAHPEYSAPETRDPFEPWPMISPAICLCAGPPNPRALSGISSRCSAIMRMARALRGGAMRIICCVAMWTSM